MTKVKLLLLLLSLLALFACSLADVDEESDFSPTYDKLVGCWVSTENVVQEEMNYENQKWKTPKCILLSDRKQSEKDTCFIIHYVSFWKSTETFLTRE